MRSVSNRIWIPLLPSGVSPSVFLISRIDPREAMCIVTEQGYGTVSSTLLALPAADHPERERVWRFAAGRPDTHPFEPVTNAG